MTSDTRIPTFVFCVFTCLIVCCEAMAAPGDLDVRFAGDGIQTTFIGTGYDDIRDMALQSDGKIVVAGTYDGGGDNDWYVLRYLPDGARDTSFSGDGL